MHGSGPVISEYLVITQRKYYCCQINFQQTIILCRQFFCNLYVHLSLIIRFKYLKNLPSSNGIKVSDNQQILFLILSKLINFYSPEIIRKPWVF